LLFQRIGLGLGGGQLLAQMEGEIRIGVVEGARAEGGRVIEIFRQWGGVPSWSVLPRVGPGPPWEDQGDIVGHVRLVFR
jgi:hypothetical protein